MAELVVTRWYLKWISKLYCGADHLDEIIEIIKKNRDLQQC